ncbi:MAG: 30S ribosomal protein S21 [Polyangiales bacterium]
MPILGSPNPRSPEAPVDCRIAPDPLAPLLPTCQYAAPMSIGEAVQCKQVEVSVGEGPASVPSSTSSGRWPLRGILRELKRRRHYMKPSVRRRKKEAEAARRRRKRVKQFG